MDTKVRTENVSHRPDVGYTVIPVVDFAIDIKCSVFRNPIDDRGALVWLLADLSDRNADRDWVLDNRSEFIRIDNRS